MVSAPPPPRPPRLLKIVVAAGRGVRAGGALPKQYRLLGGIPVLRRAVKLLLGPVPNTRVVIHPDDLQLYGMALDGLDGVHPGLMRPVFGGATRQASVLEALEASAEDRPEYVLIHDAVRPFASEKLVTRLLDAIGEPQRGPTGIVPCLPVVDTLKKVNLRREVVGTLDRTGLAAVQTPQLFRYEALLDAHREAVRAGRDDFTDDAALLEWRGAQVSVVDGEVDNFKLTTPEDFVRAERLLDSVHDETRSGVGYDVHAFGSGDHVWLGGVRIAHAKGVVAHSDGDVVLHALTDAVLGAIGKGDIGTHFPPSDPQWKGAASDRFLAHAIDLLHRMGGRLLHLDVTVIAEAPRVGPHRAAMTTRIARVCHTTEDRVSIKATTSEKLGFTGRGEGLAALAVATVRFERNRTYR
jgi:2-C-methyl-D-erythritol 4-phosphate cytidylyltransferase/2-C-methyl-D-erythritol 2,4-cyclodiphosphate synthase